MWGKKQIDLIPKIKSTDKMNREIFDNKLEIPKLPSIGQNDKKYIKSAIIYIEKYFMNNYGNAENFIFPITHSTGSNKLCKSMHIFKPFNNKLKI